MIMKMNEFDSIMVMYFLITLSTPYCTCTLKWKAPLPMLFNGLY